MIEYLCMNINKLPLEFLERMKIILKQEYEDFLLSYEKKEKKSLRINTLYIND